MKALLDECADRQWVGQGRGRGRVVDGSDQDKKKEVEEAEKGKEKGKEKVIDRDEGPPATSRARTAHTRGGIPTSCSSFCSPVSRQCTHITEI